MTKIKFLILAISLSISSFTLYAQNNEMLDLVNQGAVTNTNYNAEIPFRYVDGYIFIEIVQNDKAYNFLFDTGAELTVLDNSIKDAFDLKVFSEGNISGPLIPMENINILTLSSIHIAEVEFVNTGAATTDLKFAKAKFCNKLDGIIGSTLIKNAKWQIDYQKQVIRLSNDLSNLLSTNPAYKLTTKLPVKGWGTETVEINIDGHISDFNLDTGNGRESIVSHPNKFRKLIKNNKASVIEYGFKKSDTNYKLTAATLTMGNLKLSNKTISLQNEVGNSQLLGNKFLDNFLVTMDWENHEVYLDPIKKGLSETSTPTFELNFKPNYESKKIEIATGLKTYTKIHKIENGAILLQVNDTDVSNFSHQQLCDFWNITWPQITDAEHLQIVISENGKTKALVVNAQNRL